MNATLRQLAKDLLTRGGFLFAALCGLQLLTALSYYGMTGDWSLTILPMMIVAMVPVFAPSRRLLATLPLSSRAVDRIQWLYGGGLVALCLTATNILAWLVSITTATTPPLWTVALLVLGTPGTVGLSMALRRWTFVAAVHPNDQPRSVLLSVYISTTLIAICMALLRISLDAALPIAVVLGGGWIVFALFYVSPSRYYRWLDRTHATRDGSAPRTGFFPNGPWSYAIVAGLICGGVIGGVIGSVLAWLTSRTEMGGFLTVAATAAIMSHAYAYSAKLLRTLPWSLTRCATFVWTMHMVPICAAVLSMYVPCAVASCASDTGNPATLLPVIAVASLIAPSLVLLRLTGITARLGIAVVYLFLFPLLVLTYTQNFIVQFCVAYPVVANGLAILVLAASWIWIRRELVAHTIGHQNQTSAYAMSS